MSGSTIGGVVGGAIGFYFGGPQGAQVGWMIGSAVGGYVDPEQISQFGPRLQDAAQQTANDGIPIPYGYGTFPTRGNIIWCGPVVEHVNESTDDGKGSGVETTTTTYSYSRSYAIGICQGEIAGLLQIKRNGKIVWDARTDEEIAVHYDMTPGEGLFRVMTSNLRATTAKFSTISTIYTGSETQTADPTIEAHEGVGNVPGFRGLAYIVVTDDDVTDLRGAVPQYEFVVRVCGEFTGYYVEPGAWAADADAAVVHQIGPTDGEQVAHTVAGTDKMGIAMSPDARHVWVINSTNGSAPYSMSKVSTVDGSVGLTFDLTGTPRQVVASPDGDFLYVGDLSDNSVVKYGTGGGGEVDRTVGLGNSPLALAISADGSEVYAGVTGLKVIDASDMSVTATIGASEGTISGLAVSPTDEDKLYATVSAASGFLAIDLSDSSYAVKTGPQSPKGLCFIPDGTKAYFLNSPAASVAVVNAATDTWARNFDCGASFESIACSMNGDKLYAGTSAFGADLHQLDVATETVTEIYPSVRAYQRRGIAARPLP